MCLTGSVVRGLHRWNWEGDRILHECLVPAARQAPGSRKRYPVDVRELLVTHRSELLRQALEGPVRKRVERTGGAWERFHERSPGAFDHRAFALLDFVGHHVRYLSGPRDPWQTPAETLALRTGDCEDRALLLAALLLAAGVSPYCVRVALGHLVLRSASGRRRRVDHAWVVYKTEAGGWAVLEPESGAKARATAGSEPISAEYRPAFVFNDAHLWEVLGATDAPPFDRIALSRKWSRFDPRFAGSVHRSILNTALVRGGASKPLRDRMNARFSQLGGFFGEWVERIDRDLAAYDPREHFDDGYVDEGWTLVTERLDRFAQDNAGYEEAFARAAHAICDFYAHSSYAHFAQAQGAAAPFDPARPPAWLHRVQYDAAPFDLGRFTTNPRVYRGAQSAAELFRGKLISGRYAQEGDTAPGVGAAVSEGQTHLPAWLTRRADWAQRGALPHHDEIAVDSPVRSARHRLYRDLPEYQRQYQLRIRLATEHLTREFTARWRGAT